MKTRTVLTTVGLVLLVALVLDLLVLLPMRTVGSLEGFYGPLDNSRRGWIALIVIVWVVVSMAVLAWHVYRLAAPRTWSWNFEFSPWRVVRSHFFVVGLVCVGSVIPGAILSAAPVVTNSSEETGRAWNLLGLVLAVGGLAMSAAIVMYLIGAIVVVIRDVRELNRPI